MVFEFKFPDVWEGIKERTIVKWKIKEGDNVQADQILAEVETDKAVVEIPSPKKGTILKLYHKAGEIINVGETLVVIGKKGEKVPDKKERYTGSVVGFLPEAKEEKSEKKKKIVVESKEEKVSAAPLVRKLAKMLDVNLSAIKGTGPGGRIIEEDVKNSVQIKKTAAPGFKKTKKYDFFGYVDHVPLKGIKKITAEKMMQAVTNSALLTHHDHVDVTELNQVRKDKNSKSKVKLTYLPYIIRASIESIKKHPLVASEFGEGEIIIKKYYNIGVAVDTPDGLMVPVIKGADKKTLVGLSKEIANYVEKAKSRKIDLMDLRGGVFTITNIGVIGSTYFTPIVNYPESCILGTGRIEDQVRVINGKIEIRKILPISFTYDHRVLDGAEAARFMNDLRALLEKPSSLLD